MSDIAEQMNILRPYLLDAREDYPEPYYMLEYNGVPFSALGGIQAISGQKKNGKTFVLSQLIAAVLCSGIEELEERLERYLPGLKVPQRTIDHIGHLPKVLYVDTEMEKLNSAKVLRRVHWLCDWDMNEPNERFSVLWLRSVTDEKDDEGRMVWRAYQKRWYIISTAIEVLKPDFVIIDGIRDIIGDFNNNEEASSLVNELMALAERKQICIWNALHMNPRPGNDDDSKMRGHLGTELGNKVTDTLVSIKKKDSNGVFFTVKQLDARGKDLDDWQFEITDSAGGLGIPEIIRTTPPKLADPAEGDSPEAIKKWIEDASKFYEWPMSRAEIKSRVFGDIGLQKNHAKQNIDLTIAINSGYLTQSARKKNGSWMLEPTSLIEQDDSPF